MTIIRNRYVPFVAGMIFLGTFVAQAHAGQTAISGASSGAASQANNRLVNAGNSTNRNSNRNLNRNVAGASSLGNTTTFNSKGVGIAPSIGIGGGQSGINVCDTSIGFGGSGLAGGLAINLPWKDHECNVRSGMIALAQVRQGAAAQQMGCQDDEMAQALEATGVRCLVGPRAVQNVNSVEVRRFRRHGRN